MGDGPLPAHGRVPAWGAHPEARTPICQAPWVAMEFDPRGDVQACCANFLHPLGNVADSTLEEIWRGPQAEALRERLRQGDLSSGCSVCRYRLTYGHGDLARDYYDRFPAPPPGELWPHSLQFSLHNTCNLACAMCGSDRSSRIRSRRDGLPPLPVAYGDAFFEQLPPFLAHARAVDFSGGEPFLVAAHHRVWDLLIEGDHRPLHSLTTNGTVWDERVERVLDALDTHVAVSVDGMTAETFEAIRVGAGFAEVLANLDRFLAHTRERGTVCTLGWSLLQQNWHELPAAARFAEERGIELKVHTVIEVGYGVQRLPTDALERVVRELDVELPRLLDDAPANGPVVAAEVARLRAELAHRATGERRPVHMEAPGPTTVDEAVAAMWRVDHRRLDGAALAEAEATARADLARWGAPVVRFEVDAAGGLADAGPTAGLLPAGVEVPLPEGPTTFAALLHHLERELPATCWVLDEFDEGDRGQHTFWLGRRARDKVGLVVRTYAIGTSDGVVVLASGDQRFWPDTGTVPVPDPRRRAGQPTIAGRSPAAVG